MRSATRHFRAVEDPSAAHARVASTRDASVAEKRVYLVLRFFEPSAISARTLTKASSACEGVMPLRSERDPDVDSRWAAWLARGAAPDRAVRSRVVTVVPATFAVAVIVSLWSVR